jgi:hypothetical protein
MALRGQRPKPPGQAITRHPRHDWVEIERSNTTRGPRLPPRRRNGRPWPESVRRKWSSWRQMPHTVLWQASDWDFAFDAIELVARAADGDAPIALLSEIRLRERTLGTTWDARHTQRLRYVQAKMDGPPGPVSRLDDYRDL